MSTELTKKDTEVAIPSQSSIDINAAGELQISSSVAGAIQEIQAAVFLAKKFPRNYDSCWAKLQKAVERKSLAEKAAYAYPRGGKTITGPSVYLARVAAQCFQNMRWGLDILRNDEDYVTIQGYAWDIEVNNKCLLQDTFEKLIYRKGKGWIKPDERDLRELVNRRGAILVRNAIYNILPKDLVEDAIGAARSVLKKGLKDPDGEKKHLIKDFLVYNVTVEMINKYLGHDIWTKDDILDLQAILLTIKEGAAKVDTYFELTAEEVNQAGLDLKDLKPGDDDSHQSLEKDK